jgi:hypothetical protein
MPPIMSQADWERAAEAFDVPPEEVPWYQEAFGDVERNGLDTFATILNVELLAAIAKAPAPPDVVRRLQIRKIVLVELCGGEELIALAAFEGTPQ